MTSTIKVNTVKDTASTDIIKKCGTSITVGTASDTTTVAGNAVRSNALQASDGANIVSQVGTTITLGASGDTIALASGANQTGFGRTGTVDWQTTPKTATFTAVSGEGYFANTTGSAFNMNLPAGSAGAIVSVADYAETFDSNNLTIVPNGTDKIGSLNENAVLETKGQSVTLVFVDSTQGWINTMDSTSNVRGAPPFICASVSGACNTLTTAPCCANVKIATFTGPGNFTVNSISGCAANNLVSHLVIAGGGGGGGEVGGGGGAGGFREVKSPTSPYTASPLDGYPNAPNRVTVTAQAYPIAIGGGGTGVGPGGFAPSGGVSTFDTITSAGGGGGGSRPGNVGQNGGSGGGAGGDGGSPGSGNTPPVSPSQGSNGGGQASPGCAAGGGGGGGATAVGNTGLTTPAGGDGGAGATTSITGSPVARAGGGGGGSSSSSPSNSTGGSGGGGIGVGPGTSTAGTANTGGGGGAGNNGSPNTGRNGGSGIVVIRYKFQ